MGGEGPLEGMEISEAGDHCRRTDQRRRRLNSSSSSEICEQWLDSGHILMEKHTRLYVECEENNQNPQILDFWPV